VARWCEPGQAGRQHDWLAGDGTVISAEPPRRIRAMAAHLRGRPELVEALRRGTPAAARRAVAALPVLAAELERYLDDFGDRCMEELKLETLTLREDPIPLLRSIGAMAWRLDPAGSSPLAVDSPAEPGPRVAALGSAPLGFAPLGSAPLGPELPGRPWRRWWLQILIARTRALLSNRENLRFERTRVFGQARRLLLELGRRYEDLGLLEQAADVLFLEVEEVLGVVEAHASGADLAALVEVRRRAWRRRQQQPPLPRRLETRGLPALATASWLETAATSDGRDGPAPGGIRGAGGGAVPAAFWQGIGCAPGRVRGQVSLVADPRRWLESPRSSGASCSILVATSTDPGWVLLFPHAAGLLVERGSVLSHVAIVARELGLPMVTELGGISTSLREGDWVELDGRAGTVRLLEGAGGCAVGAEVRPGPFSASAPASVAASGP
jgi:phosphohistidine swiveling domain-containing protein